MAFFVLTHDPSSTTKDLGSVETTTPGWEESSTKISHCLTSSSPWFCPGNDSLHPWGDYRYTRVLRGTWNVTWCHISNKRKEGEKGDKKFLQSGCSSTLAREPEETEGGQKKVSTRRDWDGDYWEPKQIRIETQTKRSSSWT